MAYDLIIRGGRVFDGSGSPWYRADVAVHEGRIAHVAPHICTADARKVIDATDLAVCPGFIDPHSHDDSAPLVDPYNLGRLSQGVTTVIAGNCGYSLFPVTDSGRSALASLVAPIGFCADLNWSTCSDMAGKMFENGSAVNIAYLVGHNAVRVAVMQTDDSEPTREQLGEMKCFIEEAMKEGAFGFSTGLIYVPGVFSDTPEIVELTRAIKPFGGVYVTHMRDEADNIRDALCEAITVAREAGVPVHIAHAKISGRDNWGRAGEVLDVVSKARDQGIDVTLDAYPYTAGASFLASALPPFVKGGGDDAMMKRLKEPEIRAKVKHYINERTDWQNWPKQMGTWDCFVVGISPKTPEYEGKSISEIAQMRGADPVDTLMDIVAVTGHSATAVLFMMNEEDVQRFIASPLVMVGTDAPPPSERTIPHPRGFGTYAKVLGRYAREQGILSMEEAIRKMSSMPAIRFNLQSKGLVREGFDADLVVFDPDTVADNATYTEPDKLATGFEHVLVGGVVAFSSGKPTGELPGRWVVHKR